MGISDYTRRHCQWICEIQQQIQPLEVDCVELITSDEFQPYLEAMYPFKFGIKNQVGLLLQIYPFERFLVNGQPWVERRISRNGKRVKCDHSLRSFQSYLGLSFTLEQSGDSGRVSKRFSGSKKSRSHLYGWAKMEFDQQRGKRVQFSPQGQALWEKHKQLRRLQLQDDGKFKPDDGAIALL